jgi:hypothetical protein
MAKITFRLPGKEQYSYAEVEFDHDLRIMSSEEVAEELKVAVAALDRAYPDAAERPTTAAAPQAAAATTGSANARTCPHGEMKLKEGRSAKGVWSAWMCSERDRAQQCKPIDGTTGKPWS